MKTSGTNAVIHGNVVSQIGVCSGANNSNCKAEVSTGISANHGDASTVTAIGTGARIGTSDSISQASNVIVFGTTCGIAGKVISSKIGSCRHAVGARTSTGNGSNTGVGNDTASTVFGSNFDYISNGIGSRNGVVGAATGSSSEFSPIGKQSNKNKKCEEIAVYYGVLSILLIDPTRNAQKPSFYEAIPESNWDKNTLFYRDTLGFASKNNEKIGQDGVGGTRF